MRSPLPVPHQLGVLALAAAFALWPALALAFAVQVSAPSERNGELVIATTLVDPFDTKVEKSLRSGLPITVEVRAELWRRRGGWFRGPETTFGAVMRIGYETLRDRYRVERTGSATRYFGSIDSLARHVTRPWNLPLARLSALPAGPTYYASVRATLKPLTLEDAEEVEGWLSGEDRSAPGAGVGMLAGLPRALFEAARSMAGFGDRQANARSGDFTRR